MICPFADCATIEKTTFEYNDAGKVVSLTKKRNFSAKECLGSRCPFYSDGTGEYVEGACIRVEKILSE